MIFSRSSSAWVLVVLQTALGIFFFKYLSATLPSSSDSFNLFQTPSWFGTLISLHFGLAILLALCALWKFEITGIVLLFAIHIVCPLLFFTDLTRNPYFTQIVLLNVWIAFLWIAWLWEAFSSKNFVFPKTVLDIPLFAFFCVVTLSWIASFIVHEKSFYQSMFWEGLKGWLFLVLNVIAVYYIAVMVDEKWRWRFIWVTFWIAGIAAAYGLMQFYGIERIWQKTLTPFANRPVSTFGNPNFLSSYLLLVIPLLVVSTLIAKKTSRAVVALILLLVAITGLIATMTRSTWVGALASLSLLPFAKSFRVLVKNNLHRFTVFLFLVAVCVVFWPSSKLGGYRNPLERLTELREIKTMKSYHPWHQRILIWSCSFSMIKDHLFLGKGWGLMELFYPYYQGKELFHPILAQFRTHANNSHNEVLEVWSQTGFLGMGIYTWLWIVLIFFGVKLARSDLSSQAGEVSKVSENSEKAILGWALTSAAVGMFVDNFFGNVSLHFAVPGFLFWWQAGLLSGMDRVGTAKKGGPPSQMICRTISIDHNGKKLLLTLGILFLIWTCIFNFRREFQEIYYFRGFKISKTNQFLDNARQELEMAWLWYPREVNTNYELANVYARLSQETSQAGLTAQSENWKKKAIWAYLESLRSNCGYDEIYFNLAAIQTQMGWIEDDFPDFFIETPRKISVPESAKVIGGAIYNYSRALAINPFSQDACQFLGNVFLQNTSKYQEQAMEFFQQATRLFPENKDFWVNLSFLQIKSKNLENAYESLKKAMSIDPFYELTRKNLRALLNQMNRPNDPLAMADRDISQMNTLIQSKNWSQLREVCERLVRMFPENFQLRFVFANVCFELRLWERAEKEYDAALKLDPRSIMALNNLALTYRSQNKIAETKKIYEKILSINPNDEAAKRELQTLSQ